MAKMIGKPPIGASAGKKVNKGTFKRVLKGLSTSYKFQMIVVLVCLVVSAVAGSCNSIFIKNIIADVIEPALGGLGFSGVSTRLAEIIILMASIYVLGVIASFVQNRVQVVVTQKYLRDVRREMFVKMQALPINYFDTHTHGEIMSRYTNDVDSLRQMVSSSLTQIISSSITLIMFVAIMLSYSIWLTLVMFIGVFIMTLVTKSIGGKSRHNFLERQKSIAKCEGYIEEIMHGQKVVKVFCHEDKCKEDFETLNEKLCEDDYKSNKYANILMPIMGNIGNFLYVLVAFVGGLLVVLNIPNLSLSGFNSSFGIPEIVAFLTMTRSFSMNITQLSNQANSIIMGLAGASRIFEFIDEKPEIDNGYVTLVRADYNESGEIVEAKNNAGSIWAWKHPHNDGSLTYTELKGDVRLFDVDFGYVKDKIVLHGVTLYAKPGQKVAFVGATGAGKTTITNLLNRFYDIADGKIRYDGININKIKKSDLRKSIGMVLQDTNLFTGTVRDNIRYGKLDATEEEIVNAAKIANAHSFITRLPKGYDTMLTGDGANLSQGQRQLISIARAAVANAPVMILDEATSSIDTRTELLVQKGTDQLMEGRTVFVIAHRLSTVQNSNVIMVLDHGRIIERGTHEELIEQKGVYYQLYTGKFELD